MLAKDLPQSLSDTGSFEISFLVMISVVYRFKIFARCRFLLTPSVSYSITLCSEKFDMSPVTKLICRCYTTQKSADVPLSDNNEFKGSNLLMLFDNNESNLKVAIC